MACEIKFKQFDVVKVPFPFTDSQTTKRRPALIVSTSLYYQHHAHLILCMITSAKNSEWPGDVTITDLTQAGLPCPSVVRFKLFTLDARFIIDTLGTLNVEDQAHVMARLKQYMFVSE